MKHRPRGTSTGPRRREGRTRRSLLIGGAVVALALLVLASVLVPWPVLVRWRNPSETAYMLHRQAQARAIGEELVIRHEWVPLEEISRHLQRAVLVAEDHRFREHAGVDWLALAEEVRYDGSIPLSFRDADDRRALLDAVRYYRENQDRIRGRSTITQQLARNLYLSPERSLVRKVRELLIARRLERHLSKDRILELYLNVAEWGPGLFGAEAASQAYFGRPAAQLSLFQAASLAGTLPHPLTSNPARSPGRMAWRRDLILSRMDGRGPAAPLPLPEPEIDLPDLDDVLPWPEPAVPMDSLERDTILTDTVPPVDTVPPRDTIPPGDGVLPPGMLQPLDPNPPSDSLPHLDRPTPLDTLPPRDVIPLGEPRRPWDAEAASP